MKEDDSEEEDDDKEDAVVALSEDQIKAVLPTLEGGEMTKNHFLARKTCQLAAMLFSKGQHGELK